MPPSEESSSTERRFQSLKPCRFWLQGNCKYGDMCRFSHANQRGVPSLVQKGKNREDQPTVNEDLGNTPKLLFNELYTDGTSNSKAELQIQSSTTAFEARSCANELVCRDWKAGTCPRGNRCRYRHGSTTEGIQVQNSPSASVARTFNKRAGIHTNTKQKNKGVNRANDAHDSSTFTSGSAAGLERQETILKAQEEARRKEEDQKADIDRRREEQSQRIKWRRAQIERRREEERHGEEERHREGERLREEEKRRREEERLREERRMEEERLREEERLIEEERRRAERRAEMERQEEERKERERVAHEAREAKWKEEANVIEQYVVFESCLLTCGAGLDIRHIITGFDLCRITVKNLPRDAKASEIADIFTQQGISTSEFFITGIKPVGNAKEAVVLTNAEQGQAIALGLEGIEFRNEVLSFEISDNAAGETMGATGQSRSPFLTVSWRVPTNAAVATYLTSDEAQRRARDLDGEIWKGQRIKATLDNFRRGSIATTNSVKITNCPPNAAFDSEFRDFIGSLSLRFLKPVVYDHQHCLLTVRTHLSQQKGTQMNTYEVLESDDTTGETRVKVHFDDWDGVKQAHDSIHNKKLGRTPNLRAWHPRPLQYSIMIPKRQYLSQKKQWDALSEKRPGRDAYVQTRAGDRGDVYFIRVLGDDKKATGALKVRVESLVSGEALDVDHWHPSFLSYRQTKQFFDKIHNDTGAHVRTDFKTRRLKLYGEPEVIEEARNHIKAEVGRLQELETTRVIDRTAVGFFVREGLGRLKELLGEENVRLNLSFRPCRITIKGGEEARRHLQRLLEESRTASVDESRTSKGEGDLCPVCYGDASNPEQLGCGHTYCAGCLQHFLSSAADTKTFPLVCIGNEVTCNTPISIPFIRRFMTDQAFQHLVDVVFTCYLEQHPQAYKYCTTPDCKQIYQCQTEKTTLQCPSCFSSICPTCGEESHEGMSCEERRIQRDPAAQERQIEQLGFKKCPQCKAWIEKNGGCNHIECTCGAHICWRCMGVFSSAEIYGHMQNAHDGMYDELPAGIDVGVDPGGNFLAEQADALAQVERQRAAMLERQQQWEEIYRQQQQVENIIRQREEAVRRQQQEDAFRRQQQEDFRRQQRQDAMRRQQEEDAIRRRQQQEETTRRQQQEDAMRRWQQREEQIRRERTQRETARRRQLEAQRTERAQNTTERRGWCVVM